MKGLLGGVVLAMILAAGASAATIQDGVNAARRGDYATALMVIQPLADQGNPAAQFVLGDMYDTGQGVPQDSSQAAKWYRRAADQGFAEAQNNLAALYSNGEGVPHDHGEALKWWRLAADQGLPTAQANLAMMYADGDGIPQDLVQAFKWSTLAATQGEPRASDILSQVSMKMNPDEINTAQRLIRAWMPANGQHL